ncbi:hypothetical protein CPT_Merlin79 [Citrobacter phage Merlin]|uniref:Uncharacterized protein n=1 Tax=Citrobacter phage Merlin TaxID=1675602 RepID=A0A0K1LNJ9_9CAUD|nr:hypothetical protein CPT_Merlin79 [Citrobacter phage Merlin]AKU43725.1 hypothetical protein CPT_Merlin79 [Citrobacter phage Merlin]
MQIELKYVSCQESGWHLSFEFDDGFGVAKWFPSKPTKAQIRYYKKWARIYWLYD